MAKSTFLAIILAILVVQGCISKSSPKPNIGFLTPLAETRWAVDVNSAYVELFNHYFKVKPPASSDLTKLLLSIRGFSEKDLIPVEATHDKKSIIDNFFLTSWNLDFSQEKNLRIFEQKVLEVIYLNEVFKSNFKDFNSETKIINDEDVVNSFNKHNTHSFYQMSVTQKQSGKNYQIKDEETIEQQNRMNLLNNKNLLEVYEVDHKTTDKLRNQSESLTAEVQVRIYREALQSLIFRTNLYQKRIGAFIADLVEFQTIGAKDLTLEAENFMKNANMFDFGVEADSYVQKIMVILDLVASIEKNQSDYLAHIEEFGKSLISHSTNFKLNYYWRKLFERVMQLFSKSVAGFGNVLSDEQIRIGVSLFCRYFDQSPNLLRDKNLLQFINAKYQKESIISHKILAKSYIELQLYIIDVFVAVSENESTMNSDDFKTVTSSFFDLFTDFSFKQLKTANYLKELLVKTNAADMNKHFSLYNALYNTIVSSISSNEAITHKETFVQFNKYLDDQIVNKEYKPWLPNFFADADIPFDTDIKTNYPFYKLINLAFQSRQMMDSDFEFKPFSVIEDQRIHEFTLKPHVKPLFELLKASFFPKLGFNYRHLSGIKMESNKLKELIEEDQRIREAFQTVAQL